MIRIGTSGFSYDDWVGPVYPPGLPKRDWLSFYAREFSTVEVNSTYYAVPSPKTMESMAAKTPAGFLFTVKAHQDMTHKRGGERGRLRCLQDGHGAPGRRGQAGLHPGPVPLLLPRHRPQPPVPERLPERLAPLPLVAEFRNREWLSEETFADLRRQGVGFCCVDEPRLPGLIPPVAEATSEIAYVRFHGRNAAKWWEHKEAYERYDYTYKRGGAGGVGAEGARPGGESAGGVPVRQQPLPGPGGGHGPAAQAAAGGGRSGSTDGTDGTRDWARPGGTDPDERRLTQMDSRG